jgi:hypothetical protein
MPPVEFEPTNSAGEGRQTYAVDRTATGTGKTQLQLSQMYFNWNTLVTGHKYGPSAFAGANNCQGQMHNPRSVSVLEFHGDGYEGCGLVCYDAVW